MRNIQLFILFLIFPFLGNTKVKEVPNVLFIAVDDLRPELNCYGQSHIISPNIDKLASDGLVFKQAYCNIPVCGASRASLLTGLYPEKTRFTNYGSRADKDAPGIVTLPEHFKRNGYATFSIGKIFHHPDDALQSWSETPYRPDYPNSISQQELWRDYQSEENNWTKTKDLPLGAAGPAWEAADVADSVYYDGKTTHIALKKLNELAKSEQPFFLGVGFIRPHLPFNAPKKYWDLYNPKQIELAANPFMPENAPANAWHNYNELRSYKNISRDTLPIPDETAKKLRHGYYACVSFIDAQIGQIIERLKALGMYDNTIIVIWGDHGWSLGEHSLWCKHSCFEKALRSALIVRYPEAHARGTSDALLSYIDIYPSLCEMAGLESPSHLDGKSFLPVLNKLKDKTNAFIFCRWQNGETVKSDQFIYTQYLDRDKNVVGEMLYDHLTDPEENKNVIQEKKYCKQVNLLRTKLENHINTREGRTSSKKLVE